jgi:inner membrane protein involved in colicin E2 resistance
LIAFGVSHVQSPAMPEMQPPPPLPKSQPAFLRRHSTLIKLFGVGALILVMLIPLAMIRGVLSDRLQRRDEAVNEITDSWGKDQNIIGPVLGVPFQYKFKSMKDTIMPDGHVERREVEEMRTHSFCPNRSRLWATQKRKRCIAGSTMPRSFARKSS